MLFLHIMPNSQTLKTPDEARAWFEGTGTSVAAWCRQHDVPVHAVYSVLSGRGRGRRGDAHRAAVALGIKAGLSIDQAAPGAVAPAGSSVQQSEEKSVSP